jgi:hypothetical protein
VTLLFQDMNSMPNSGTGSFSRGSLVLCFFSSEVFRSLSCLPFVLFVCCCSGLESENAPSNSTADSFKSFLSVNPAISNIVFERQVLIFPHLPNGVKPNTNEVQYYQGGLQSNGFYIRRLWSLDDVNSAIQSTTSTAGLLFAGKAASRLWHIVNTNIYSTSDAGNYVAQMSINAEAILTSAICLGVDNLVPGSLVWSSNTFTGRSTAAGEVRGTLELSENLPRRMTVQYQGIANTFVVEYTYSNGNRLP